MLIYVGQEKLRMPDRLAEDGNLVKWEVVDVSTFDAAELIASGTPGDLALAILAGGARERIDQLLVKAGELKGSGRGGCWRRS